MARDRISDLVVVVPGILGSRLAVDGREVWGLSGRAAAEGVRTLGRSVSGLRLPADIGDDHPGDGVVPVGLMRGLHVVPGLWSPVRGYVDLWCWLQQSFVVQPPVECDRDVVPNLLAFPYDWRLSNRYNARLLRAVVAGGLERWRASARERAEARVVFVCHSMGGLVARYYVECLGGAEVTRAVVTLGTPYRGSVDALLTLVNGVRRGLGRIAVDLSALARGMPSLYQLAPDYECMGTGRVRTRAQQVELPGLHPSLLADGEAFHAEIAAAIAGRGGAAAGGFRYLPVRGTRQPTPTTATLDGERLVGHATIGGVFEGGDGRVVRFSAHPGEMSGQDPVLRSHAEQHGSLQDNTAVREALLGWLGAEPPVYRGPDDTAELGLSAGEFMVAGEDYPVEVAGADRDDLAVQVSLTHLESNRVSERTLRPLGSGRYRTVFPAPAPGAYELAAAPAPAAGRVRTRRDRPAAAVTGHLLVWEPDHD